MTATIIDRRDHYKNKSSGSRQRFIQRYKENIKESIKKAINRSKGFTDLGKPGDKKIVIDSRGLSEPHIIFDDYGGVKEKIFPGNDRFNKGDKILKPRKNASENRGASDGDNSEDGFIFYLNEKEFTDILFEDLELPNLTKQNINKSLVKELVYDGLINEGNPSQLNVLHSYRNSKGRRIGLNRKKYQKEIVELEEKIKTLEIGSDEYKLIQHRIALLKAKVKAIPFFDKIDVRYRHHEWQSKPIINATMFCIMDISGSMTEEHKILAKYFFYILYLFLKRRYLNTEVVFIVHTSEAEEVDEKTFFYSQINGGTIVMSSLELCYQIIQKKFNPQSHNIYIAQASDGDASPNDAEECSAYLLKKLLPLTQYYIYSQISPGGYSKYNEMNESNLWKNYSELKEKIDNFDMIKISKVKDIIPVFRKLFEKK